MNDTLLPNDLEMNYRKAHYKNVQNVLNCIIFCAICNVDLKQDITLNGKIMVHKTFLCLCCKNCFEKLSDSPDGCILCSAETKLKTCEICNHHMCQGCIYNFYMKSSKLKKLKGCLKCSCNVLWSLRSQTIAVLKCYSLELDSRLLLNGEESENKQRLYEFLKNSAKSNESCTLEVLNDMRVKYLYDKLISETQPLHNKILKLQIENIDQSSTIFNQLCKQLLENTSSVLFDFKCLFNDQIVELIYNKIKSVLNDPTLLKSTENYYKERLKYYHETINALDKRFSTSCCISLAKLDEESLKPHISKMKSNRTIRDNEKINHDTKNDTNFSMETQSQQHNNLNLTCENSNQLKPASVSKDVFMSLGEVEIKSNEEIKYYHVKTNTKEKVYNETDNQITTRNSTFNSDDPKLNMHPVVQLQKLDNEFIKNITGNINENKSGNIIANQTIEYNQTEDLVSNNKDLNHVINTNKFAGKYNTIVEKPSKNKNNKINCEGNTRTKKTNNKRKKSAKCNSEQTYYMHKKFRREERF